MPAHPLDPLSSSEIDRTVELLRGSGAFGQTYRFASIKLAEPPKAEVMAWRPVTRCRAVAVGVLGRQDNTALRGRRRPGRRRGRLGGRRFPDVTPNFTVDE